MLPWQPMQALSGVPLGSSFSLTYFCPDVIPSPFTPCWASRGGWATAMISWGHTLPPSPSSMGVLRDGEREGEDRNGGGEEREGRGREGEGRKEVIYRRTLSPRNGGRALKAWAILWTPPSRLPLHCPLFPSFGSLPLFPV